ncbi:hypothetical protein [Mycoplasma sp. CSL10166]|uniref:hypothetical protein n=1 Tax=Mycoplasma sp. CSL10166 TaxID=2813825 RepID=UPI00197B3C42|nr:hypothetical protein [Mycoplasma sp. CSL10166]MBN4084684.1 hypothetical protein [Mycoplasma sp. CSL10166]
MKKIKLLKKILLPLLGSSVIVVASCSNQAESNISKEKESKETTKEDNEKETETLNLITNSDDNSEKGESKETKTIDEVNSDSDDEEGDDDEENGIFGSSKLSNLVGLLKGDSNSSDSVWSGGSSGSDEDENSLKQQASKKLNEAWEYYDFLTEDEDGKYSDLSDKLNLGINNIQKETGYFKGNLTNEKAQNFINRINELLEDTKAKKEAIDSENSSNDDTTKETEKQQKEGEESNSNTAKEEKQENPEDEKIKKIYSEIEDIILEAYDYDTDELTDEKYKSLSTELMENLENFKQKLKEAKETLSEDNANNFKVEIRKIVDDIKVKKEAIDNENTNGETTSKDSDETETSEEAQPDEETSTTSTTQE